MQTINARTQQLQSAADAKGCGHLGMGVAGALMLFVFCPMSIVAVAAPYWTSSMEMQGQSMSVSASLWKVSMSTEINGVSADQDSDMCGDQQTGNEECGKIHAVRFFTISALLLSLASGVILAVGFSPALKPSAALRRKMSLAGISCCSAVLLCDFLGMCIAASVSMTGQSSLNGAGFVFLILELLFVGAATALVALTLTRWSTKVVTMSPAPVVEIGKSNAGDKSPTLLSSPQSGTQKPKMTDSNDRVPEESEKDVEEASANGPTVVVAS